MFIVTHEWIEANKSPKGGFFAAQVRALGLDWPLVRGWQKTVVGKEISLESKAAFEAGAVSRSSARKANREIVAVSRRAMKKAKQEFVVLAETHGYRKASQLMPKVAKPQSRRPAFDPAVMSDAFLSSYAWRVLRMEALKLHGPKCQCCGDTPANGAVMNVDHIKPRRHFPELALTLSNLQILCGPCNHGKSNHDMTDWRGHEPELSESEMTNVRFLRSL